MPMELTIVDGLWLAAGAAVTLLIGGCSAVWAIREWRERFRDPPPRT
jgi:hypothetical protein